MAQDLRYRLADVLAALSPILDHVEGQPDGHTLRSCMIGMLLADHLPLTLDERSALFYALLLKDAGCSSNAAHVAMMFATDDFALKNAWKWVDSGQLTQKIAFVLRSVHPNGPWWERLHKILRVGIQAERITKQIVQIRCERGADIARMIGFPALTASAIYSLDEHWDGSGYPDRRCGTQIPLLARICALAQTVEVFARLEGPAAAAAMVQARRGRWFDPGLVDLFLTVSRAGALNAVLTGENGAAFVLEQEPEERMLLATEERLDQVADAFARIIDAKSPYTARHSARVTQIATAIGEVMGLSPVAVRDLRWAALLHDLGKLGISNQILDKPGRLTEAETVTMQSHASLTYATLMRIAPFRDIADIAGAHHERLDGSGYPHQLTGTALPLAARILAVADVYEALTSDRPYRAALPPHEALAIVQREQGTGLDAEAVRVLVRLVETGAFAVTPQRTEAVPAAPMRMASRRLPRARTRHANQSMSVRFGGAVRDRPRAHAR